MDTLFPPNETPDFSNAATLTFSTPPSDPVVWRDGVINHGIPEEWPTGIEMTLARTEYAHAPRLTVNLTYLEYEEIDEEHADYDPDYATPALAQNRPLTATFLANSFLAYISVPVTQDSQPTYAFVARYGRVTIVDGPGYTVDPNRNSGRVRIYDYQ